MKRRDAIATAIVALLSAGCAQPVGPSAAFPDEIPEPMLRLPPALLGRELAWQQRLRVNTGGRELALDALLEADAFSFRVALLAFERPLARLEWDGVSLTLQAGRNWPAAISAARMLNDLTLALWPADAVRAALAGDWSLAVSADERELRWQDRAVLRVRYHDANRWVIENPLRDYRIEVDSAPIAQ